MTDVTLEYVVELAEQLTPADQVALVEHLQVDRYVPPPLDMGITREALLAKHARLLAEEAFENVESLRNRYARPGLDISAEELDAYLREIGTEWEKELNEFFGDEV